MDFAKLIDRNYIIDYVINEMRTQGDVVEVGADLGVYFSLFIQRRTTNDDKLRRIFLIDTWDASHFYRPITEDEMWQRYISVVSASLEVKDVHVLRGDSVWLSRAFRDNSLDYVYIDTSHTYPATCAEIEAYIPKVRNGGILAGHDHAMPAVARAVKDTLRGKYEVFVTLDAEDGAGNESWYLMKE